jgi:hypothetical protein
VRGKAALVLLVLTELAQAHSAMVFFEERALWSRGLTELAFCLVYLADISMVSRRCGPPG